MVSMEMLVNNIKRCLRYASIKVQEAVVYRLKMRQGVEYGS